MLYEDGVDWSDDSPSSSDNELTDNVAPLVVMKRDSKHKRKSKQKRLVEVSHWIYRAENSQSCNTTLPHCGRDVM